MDCLSQLRDVKSVIASVLSDIFSQDSKMKYTKLGDVASQNSVNDLVVDMFEGEALKCDLASTYEESSIGYEICTLDESMLSDCTKGYTSSNSEFNSAVEVSSVDSGNSSAGSEDMSCKLVITYYFSFETEESGSEVVDNSESDNNEISDISMDKNNEKEESDENEFDNDMDNAFDSSFCCEDDMDLLEYSSVKNGSKNNLLDASFGLEVSDSIENMGHVDSDHFDSGNDSDISTIPATDVNNLLMEDLEISDSSEKDVNESKYCGNPATPSMRKGYIYYSSEVRLYQGELRYEDDSSTEKKFKLARRLLRKMFPSQKYVVNA